MFIIVSSKQTGRKNGLKRVETSGKTSGKMFGDTWRLRKTVRSTTPLGCSKTAKVLRKRPQEPPRVAVSQPCHVTA